MLQSLKNVVGDDHVKKRIGCFHAHHSNIEHIQKALSLYDVELVHFVDPGLDRIKADKDCNTAIIQKKISDTLAWISRCHVDAILITCTFFTANIPDEDASYSIPIIKIDGPLFYAICESEHPQILAFTNPHTVQGTMEQLKSFADRQNKSIHVEPYLLENTFELIMQNRKEEYTERVASKLKQIIDEHPDKRICTAQLSMVSAAEKTYTETGIQIGNHSKSLADYLERTLRLHCK